MRMLLAVKRWPSAISTVCASTSLARCKITVTPAAAEQLAINAVQAADFFGAVGFEGFPIQRGRSALPAKTVRFFKTLGKMRGVAVELFRDATDIDAGAAQARARQTAIIPMAAMHTASFGQGNFGPALRCHTRRSHTATATTDDEEVKIIGLECLHASYFQF